MPCSCPAIQIDNPKSECEISLKGGQVVLIIGGRGTGKSVHLFNLLEQFHRKNPCKKVFLLGVPLSKKHLLPKWITLVQKLEDVPNNTILGIEESGIVFVSSRKKDTLLDMTLELARHKNLSLVFCNINSTNIKLDIVRSVDVLVIHEPSILQAQLERRGVGRIVKKAQEEFQKLPQAERIKHGFVTGNTCEGMVSVDLPSFWSDSLSISWSDEGQIKKNPHNPTIHGITYRCPTHPTSHGICRSPIAVEEQKLWKHTFKSNNPRFNPKLKEIEGRINMTPAGIGDCKGKGCKETKLLGCPTHGLVGNLKNIELVGGEQVHFAEGTTLHTNTPEGNTLCIKSPSRNPVSVSPNALLYLFSSGCPHCTSFMPHVKKLEKKFKSIIGFQYVNIDKDPKLKAQISVFPTIFLIRGGKVKRKFEGVPPQGTAILEKEIDNLFHPFIKA